jgi:transcriptional regulator with XRE-family HTH domain
MQGSLARKLRVLRAERGLTLRQAAEQAGVRPGTLSELERGLHRPHDITLSRVAKGYGVPVEDLLEEPVPFDEAPQEPGRAVVGVGTTPEEATENLEQQLYSPAKIAQDWHRLAQRWEERLEKGDVDARSLEDFIDTLEDVALSMQASVAAERKELRARYGEDVARNTAVLRPALDRLYTLVDEALRRIDAKELEVEPRLKPRLRDKFVRTRGHLKMAS